MQYGHSVLRQLGTLAEQRYEVKTDLKECIKERGKSIADFARDMCCNYQRVSAYLNGYQRMTDEFKIKMCDVFKKWDEEILSTNNKNQA